MEPKADSKNNPRKKWSLTDRDIPVPRSHPAYNLYYALLLKQAALKKYGGEKPKCICCGFDNQRFLELDHIDSTGAKLHKKVANFRLAWWLERNNYPEGFQVLCSFCNRSKKDRTWTGKCTFHIYFPTDF